MLVTAGPAMAAAGDLDPSFGDGGKALFPQAGNGGTSGIGVQANGRVVAGITDRTAGSAFGVLGVTPQGSIDPSFGNGGVARVDLGGSERGELLALGPGDLVYAAGLVTFSGPTRTQFGLARFTPDGQVDTSFAAPNGFLASKFESLSASSDDFGFGVGTDPAGNVLVTGSTQGGGGRRDSAVARVSSAGGLDFGFGGDGGTSIAFGSADSLASDVTVQPDGKVVLGGTAFNSGVFIARLNGAGDPDGSFNGNGKLTLPGTTIGGSLAIQPDGKLIVVGGNGVDAFVERLLPNGSPDDSFSGDGRETVDFGATDSAEDVALAPDGKIVIAASIVNGAQGDYGVARLQPNGSPDTTFGQGGTARIDVTPGDTGATLALQPDGKIVGGGSSGDSLEPPLVTFRTAMFRLLGDPGGSAKGKCAGKKATVVGTNGKDKLKGTKKKDVVSAGGGKDTVKGLKGNDLICGGKGKDKLVGGPGKDKLLGQQGNDKLLGGPGKDTLKGGPGKKDKLNGGPGKDTEKP